MLLIPNRIRALSIGIKSIKLFEAKRPCIFEAALWANPVVTRHLRLLVMSCLYVQPCEPVLKCAVLRLRCLLLHCWL